MTRLVCVVWPLHAGRREGGQGGRGREGRPGGARGEVRGLRGRRRVAGPGAEVYVGVEGQVGHVLLAIELLGVAHGIAGPGSALEVWRKVAGQQRMVASVPARVSREAKAGYGGAKALSHVDQVLHLVDPLAFAPLILEPDLDDSLGKTGVFGQLFEYFWRGFGVLVKTIL